MVCDEGISEESVQGKRQNLSHLIGFIVVVDLFLKKLKD